MNLVTLIPPHGVYPGPVCAVACLWNGQKTPWEQKQVCQSPESCPGQHFISPVFAGDRITQQQSRHDALHTQHTEIHTVAAPDGVSLTERATWRMVVLAHKAGFEIRRELKRLLPYIGLYRKLRIVSTKRMRPHVFYNVVYGFRSWEK